MPSRYQPNTCNWWPANQDGKFSSSTTKNLNHCGRFQKLPLYVTYYGLFLNGPYIYMRYIGFSGAFGVLQ